MTIIRISEDQNFFETDEHEYFKFFPCEYFACCGSCQINNCENVETPSGEHIIGYYCQSDGRADRKNGYFRMVDFEKTSFYMAPVSKIAVDSMTEEEKVIVGFML